MLKTDTIAAISTALSTSGIGIIRISGEKSIEIADLIFCSRNHKILSDQKSHTVHYGWIVDGDERIDEVLVLLMKAPNSYTTEDTIEINCHGGILVMRKILEVVIKNGARMAEPGEYTKRAFLNGRIDLSQAEAVIDIINSKNSYALKSSVNQLSGKVSECIKELRKEILYHIAYIESALDDPEHISLDGYGSILDNKIDYLLDEVKLLIDSSDRGRVISEGINTAIVGKPNVGKSSLMNVLLGEDRAIVTDIAGTTRDTLEEHLNIQGISLNIIDTAGIHETNDKVEIIGIEKAKNVVNNADLVIMVIDSSSDYEENDEKIFEIIKNKKTLIVLNKIDLEIKIDKDWLQNKTGCQVVEFSAKNEIGLDNLEKIIKDLFYQGDINFNDQIYITNIRHKQLLESTFNSLKLVKNGINNRLPEDFYSIDLMNAYESLGFIVGESISEDLANEIFDKFCTGK